MVTFAALGIKSSMPTPKSSVKEKEDEWTEHDSASFKPTIGKCYEVRFGTVVVNGKERLLSARIRVDGQVSSEWIDLDTNSLLEQGVRMHVVLASREISCPDGNTPCTGAQEGVPANR